MSVNQRFKILLEHYKFNQNKLAVLLGVSATAIGNIVGGRENKPSYEIIVKLLETFNDLSPDWLLLGNGEMIRNSTNNKVCESSVKYGEFCKTPEKCNYCMLKNETINILKANIEDLRKQIEQLMNKNN